MSFNYTQHENDHVGFIEFGSHSITEVEVYKVNGELIFIDHDEPDEPMTYDECKQYFADHNADTEFEQQMKAQNIWRG